jgi:hypothetical protein
MRVVLGEDAIDRSISDELGDLEGTYRHVARSAVTP